MDENYKETDIFLWANNTAAMKEQIGIELFLFNKNYTLYSVNYAKDLQNQTGMYFLDELLQYVLEGPSQGMVVRDLEDAVSQEMVLQRTQLSKVENATLLLNRLVKEEDEIEAFDDENHEFKRVKGILARCTYPDMTMKPFYIVKTVQQAQVLKGKSAWMFDAGNFKPFSAQAGLQIPDDNQVLLVEDDIFVFNQSKFERLFNYHARMQSIARQKVAEIEAHFKLSFPEGVTLQSMVKEKKKTITKLQKIDPALVTQDQLLDQADEMGMELMVDDDGAIIILDNKDLDTFVNLLNDDYVESSMTGIKYEIRNKKALVPVENAETVPEGVPVPSVVPDSDDTDATSEAPIAEEAPAAA